MGVGWGHPRSDVWGGVRVRGGVLYSEVQCIMGKGDMGSPLDRITDGQTRLKTLPSSNFVGGR